ncbi:MAG: hypothetical protein L6Q99_14810 [Planctomycetes bacterium]|nr:hypothetical protein [Planctomycetota bacterium]
MLLALLHALSFAAAPASSASSASPVCLARPGAPVAVGGREYTPEAARRAFPELAERAVDPRWEFDPRFGVRAKPRLRLELAHPDAPGGEWEFATNSLGLWMEAELTETPAASAVLLVGGVELESPCARSQTIGARLDAALAGLHRDATHEVLVAGAPSWSFAQYATALSVFGPRRPLLCAVLTGFPDLEAGLGPFYHFTGAQPPTRTSDELAALDAARARWPDELASGLATLHRFTRHPEELDTALAAAAASLGELAGTASAHSTEIVVLWCPPFLVGSPDAREKAAREQALAEPLAVLGLGPADFARVEQARTRLFESAKALRITAVDLAPTFAAADDEVVLPRSRRLAPAGNALVAHEIAKRYEVLFASRQARTK